MLRLLGTMKQDFLLCDAQRGRPTTPSATALLYPMAPQKGTTAPAQGSSTAPSLVPIQVSRAQEGNSGTQQRRRQRGRGGKKNKGGKEGDEQNEQQQANQDDKIGNNKATTALKQKKRRNRGKKPNTAVHAESKELTDTDPNSGLDNAPAKSSKKAWARRRNVKRKGKCPWKKHIPPGSMDPITLDPLVSLPYPPFALVATEPYVPVPVWPVPKQQAAKVDEVVDNEEENRKRLEEQWGKERLPSKTEPEEQSKQHDQPTPDGDRHYHLYDGRALAYYLVSQLQFIDPLNRRDLTREELLNLDAYLGRHGYGGDTRVTEAYDAKGITVSSAGRAGQSAAGRAEIMQQEAQVLLNALFGGGAPATPATTGTSESLSGLRDLYAASQEPARSTAVRHEYQNEDTGIYAAGENGGGLVIIDDDANPGLRGGAGIQLAAAATSTTLDVAAAEYIPNTLWSASHITDRYSHASRVRQHDFPSLPAAGDSQAPTGSADSNSDKKPPSRSLQRITNVVQKTDPEQVQRQREAREEAMRRAALANMSFVPPGSTNVPPTTVTSFGPVSGQDATVPPTGPTEAQLERNRALASALGVAPSTVRQQNYNSGWARPTVAGIELDQFGNELNAAQYPDSLILEARERMTELLKLEKRWKTFLADDTSASLPLKSMNRPLRTFVHEYSDFWKLHTESFDREPKRYIHCVKMRDTSAPHPLLSDAARNWRGPGQLPPQRFHHPQHHQTEHASQQTAGQATVSREFPPAAAVNADKTQTEAQLSSRFDALSTGLARERKKLELAPRTIPAELPPFQPPTKGGTADERLREQAEERARKERQVQEQQRRVLEAAFASSDEASLSSGWEEEEQLYSSSTDDEDT